MMQKTHSQNAGFSLIELSIVIAIGAVILAGGIVLTKQSMENQRRGGTTKQLYDVMQAIDAFVDKNGYLPCPADPALFFTDAGFGIGSTDGAGACTAANLMASDENSDTDIELYAGIIPVTTLQLPHEDSIDKWRQRITYVVDRKLTFKGTDGIDGYADDSTGNWGILGQINIKNIGGTSLTAQDAGAPNPESISNAAVLLISHGENTFGAWQANGAVTQLRSTDGDPSEIENAETGTNFDNDFVQAPLATAYSFDDIVLYRHKWQLNGPESFDD
jgi:prepilin-type N-terminal cleavage/methylation domain-containing protein